MSGRDGLANALGKLAALQAVVFLVSVTWAFGGNADWVRTPLCLVGSLGIALFLAAFVHPEVRRGLPASTLLWAVPVGALNALVGASLLAHDLRSVTFGPTRYLVASDASRWLPATADAAVTLRSLWFFDGAYFSCMAVALLVENRRTLRLVAGCAVANALVLAVFGTVQKFAGFPGIYFGSVRTPQPNFFASFVYKNHWGAFMLLMVGACIGLALRYARTGRGRGLMEGPTLTLLVAAAIMALTVPVSGARACAVLMLVLLAAGVQQGVPRLSSALGMHGLGPRAALCVLALGGALALATIWGFGGDSIRTRGTAAKEEIREAVDTGSFGWRNRLYRDSWEMARQRPLFGWGMGSYPTVFRLFNSQRPGDDRVPVVFHDAHSDWLQSVCELGFAGTALLGLAVVLPLKSLKGVRLPSLSLFLLLSCSLVGAYAWVEFPFGNGAVELSWWLCFVVAVQYARLPRLSREEDAG